jgi:hypothetical protein
MRNMAQKMNGWATRTASNARYRVMEMIMGGKVDEDALMEQYDRAVDLKALVNSPGWKSVLDWIGKKRREYFNKWTEGESNAEDRARASELEALTKWVDSEIAAGNKAGEQLQHAD